MYSNVAPAHQSNRAKYDSNAEHVTATEIFPSSWGKALHVLFTARTPLGRFYKGLNVCSTRARGSPEATAIAGGLLPMSLPYPEAELSATMPTSSRSRQRELARRHAKRWVNRLITVWNFYYLGEPEFDFRKHCFACQALNPLQQKCVDDLFQDLLPFARLPPVSPKGGGRGFLKLDALVTALSSCTYAGHDINHLVQGALQVQPDRVAYPAAAGGCAPELHLSEPHRSQFLNFPGRTLAPRHWGRDLKACHKITKADERILLYDLHRAGMIVFHEEKDVTLFNVNGRSEVRSGFFLCSSQTP